MARTLDDVRHDVNPAWRDAWLLESARRIARLNSGEDRELTLDEFWSAD
ncbi:MAG TPA: hypothetical protein VGF48_05230 [Thermoanaerobaculia bacterium]|jgi:hypothetical protein